MINANRPYLWKKDVAASVDLYNAWFMEFAPKTYREKRMEVTRHVEAGLLRTNDLEAITPALLQADPGLLPMLRMSTCPPLARDRLVGLAYADRSVVICLEGGACPPRTSAADLTRNLERITETLKGLLDHDIFPWLADGRTAKHEERARALTIVADRMCGAQSDPIIRNAQEARQLQLIAGYLAGKGYVLQGHPSSKPITDMLPGTFGVRMIVLGLQGDRNGQEKRIKIPIDVVVQPHRPRRHRVPVLIECKSAGDFTNVNKRRKEEVAKVAQIRRAPNTGRAEFVLFLCGYFGVQYLGYEAAEGIDWVWEHRIEDLDRLGL